MIPAACSEGFCPDTPVRMEQPQSNACGPSLHDLDATRLTGEPLNLGCFRGQVTLVVNLASQCGYTPQYAELELLHRELSDRGFSVLGFPSNDFGAQEPGSAEEIATFCRVNYGVTFPLFSKVVTQPGAGQSAIYRFLGASGNLPDWNFCKYVVGRDGRVVAYFPGEVLPGSPEVRGAILDALAR